MTERDLIMLGVGAVVGYFIWHVVEIYRLTRSEEEPEPAAQPPVPHQEKDPADWWKECE